MTRFTTGELEEFERLMQGIPNFDKKKASWPLLFRSAEHSSIDRSMVRKAFVAFRPHPLHDLLWWPLPIQDQSLRLNLTAQRFTRTMKIEGE